MQKKLIYYFQFIVTLFLFFTNNRNIFVNSLYYDGIQSYSIYPRLDLQLCSNSSLSFDFTVSSSSHFNEYYDVSINENKIKNSYGRLLIYSEQQIQVNSIGNTKKLINSYFLVKLINGNRLVLNDYWTVNDISFELPSDYATSWFRLVYTRRSTTAEINLYKFETAKTSSRQLTKTEHTLDQITSVKLMLVFSKQVIHTNFIADELYNSKPAPPSSLNDLTTITYSKLLVGGFSDHLMEKNFSYASMKNLGKFHGYIMNLQYTSLSSQCSTDMCSKASLSQRQYAIFSSSTSKQYKLQQFSDRDSLMIDDICESDTLTHDICPRDCSCLSNNFVAPYFNCDCSDAPTSGAMASSTNNNQLKCSMLFKSFALNFDDSNYFGTSQEKFDYPILPSFTKINIQNIGTLFDKKKGVQFKNSNSRLNLMPSSNIPDADSCFWNIEDCPDGFIQHMIISIDRLDEKKANQKVVWFINGFESSSKFIGYIYKNRLYFSIYESDDNTEWLISSGPLDIIKFLNSELKITVSWLKEKYFSLHFDGFLIDMITKPLKPTLNQDIYSNLNFNRFYYEYGVQTVSDIIFNKNSNEFNHQFTLKYIRRDYFNDIDVQDSKIIVSSPLPSEIIRIDNTQRVMYKIDSPLTGVTTETIELSFRTSQADGVIFYIRNNPIITYFELVRGQPVIVVDNRIKNVYLRPQTNPLNDDQWHEVKLHRDGKTISVNIDSQHHDSSDLGQSSNNQILTGGYVYLGLADPNNINLSDKKTFVGEMVRGKVTINNVQQKVVQQPYYWPSMPAISTNQTVNIDTSQLSADGKMINIIINVYGPPGLSVNGISTGTVQNEQPDTHFIYLDNLPNTRYISVGSSDREIDFRVGGSRLESFLIKFQTRQSCGQLVTLVNDNRNFIGLEVYDGYLYSSTSVSGVVQRNQISRVRVDNGRIYQVNLKQEQQKLLCWLDSDDSYKQTIPTSVHVNTIRVGGQDGNNYGYASPYGFVGCIGAIHLNERDVIDYKFVSTDRRQSCQAVIQQPVIVPVPQTTAQPITQPTPPPSLGYISFSKTADILVYNFFYDHEKPLFEDISFIFRTVISNGILFSAHNNDESHNPHLIGAYIKEGAVHVVYLNSSFTQDLCFSNNIVDDGNLYRLNIRRNSNGHGFIQLQTYVGVTALDFYTQPGQIQFSKIVIGGADEWSRIRFFGTKLDFVGCIIDLFQINGNSVIKPTDISKERYNCNVEGPRPASTAAPPRTTTPKPACLPEGYPLSFSSSFDSITYQHDLRFCEHIHVPFRTVEARGIVYSHSSDDGSNYIVVYLRKGFINIIAKDNSGEKELELNSIRVDDGQVHELDIYCKTEGYLIAYIDQNRQVYSNRIELSSPIYLSTYTLGYFNSEKLPSKFTTYDKFKGCLQQVLLNNDCLIYENFADRYRLTCSVQPALIVVTPPTTAKRPSCLNTCQYSDSQCVVELDSRGYIIYEAGSQASSNNGRDSIRLSFMVRGNQDQDQDLLSIYHPDKNIRIYLSSGQPMIDLRGRKSKIGKLSNYNDGKWHRFVLEKNNQDLITKIDDVTSSEYVPFEFDLFGNGRLYFGSSANRDANTFHGYLKDIYVKYSNVEYDIITSAKDTRIPGVLCEGHVVLKSYEENTSNKLKCVSDPAVDSSNECSTDGVCYASLWRNSSGVIERYMRCFNREQLQPPENPILCRSQDLTRYVIQCCDTDYCNKNLELKLKDLDEKDERSIWRFRGLNSGDIEFLPSFQSPRQAELLFQFNTSKTEGNIMCTKDDKLYLKAEIINKNLVFNLNDVKTKKTLASAICKPSPGNQFNDNKWHKVQLVKKNRDQISVVCDNSEPQILRYQTDIPFVNTKFGVLFGVDCINEKVKNFNGDISQIIYIHDGTSYSFDDLQYSEDPRFTYENYVEFRPKYISEVYSDPKPIFFRSTNSSARLDKWDDSKVGRISFDFKVEIPGEDGLLFSTESGNSYFGIIINDGYLESILSPHRVPNAETSAPATRNFDRYQRLFPYANTQVNDGQWHKLEFMVLSDSVGSFVLDDDFSSKIRFPINYWNDESSIFFGNNFDLKRNSMGSFRGCLRNLVINNRLIDWSKNGKVYNIEAGCYNYRYAPNQLMFLQNQQINKNGNEPLSFINFSGDGCLKYNPNSNSDNEIIEFMFKTGSDKTVIFDSVGSQFLVHTQGPSITIRTGDDINIQTILERGVVFNDENMHRFKLEKNGLNVVVELDSKYKQSFVLARRSKLGPFFLGCSRDKKLKNKLLPLRDFEGDLQNVFYSSNGDKKIDLIERLSAGDSLLLTDGSVKWNSGIVSNQPKDNDAVTFKENSFLKLDKVNFDSDLSFSFKTNENDGLLAFLAPSVSSSGTGTQQSLSLINSNYIAVELVNGSLSMLVFLNKQQTRISCSAALASNSIKFNDNKWHSIKISREKLGNSETTKPESSITINCDNNFARLKISENKQLAVLQFNVGNLSINSQQLLPSELWLSKSSKFIGCMKDFKINQKPIDVFKLTTTESKATLQKGCKDSNVVCAKQSSCMNQGECVEGFGRTYCNCDSVSFTGQKCEISASTLSFNGSHGVEFVLHEVTPSSTEDVSLRFRTRLRNGMLFALKKFVDQPSLVISLEDGRIKCVYDREKNDKVIYVGDPNLFNNDKWHTVHVKRNGPTVLVEVIDNEKNRYHVIDDLGNNLSKIEYKYINIGSIKSPSLEQEHLNFIGSIQNCKLNGEDLLPYYINGKSASWGSNVFGNADPGENSLLLHHQLTFSTPCPITLPRVQANDGFKIHLLFKTSQENGVIFFRRGKEYRFMALELRNGRLKFVFELGGGLKHLTSDLINKNLNDKNWHSVTIKRFDRQKFSMKIDQYKELFVDIGSANPPLAELESFVIGGIVPDYQKFDNEVLGSEGFIGCLASLEINSDAPNLYSNRLNLCSNVQQGCVDLACNKESCSNNGVCTSFSNQVTCNCEMTSYTGPFCKENSNYYFFGKKNRACGLIQYSITPPLVNQLNDRLAFGFTTTDTDSSLFRVESDTDPIQYISIELREGKIRLNININQIEETHFYLDKKFNDNTYHVVNFIRERNLITFRVDNFNELKLTLKGEDGVFKSQSNVYVGAIQNNARGDFTDCYYGIMSGMFFNDNYILDRGEKHGDVGIVDYKYIHIEIDINQNRTRPLLPNGNCNLGYTKNVNVCVFEICPLNSDQISDYCSCYEGYYEVEYACVRRNDTISLQTIESSAKLIPAKAGNLETPIGLILGIISGIALALLAAAIGARKCSDGLCVPVKAEKPRTVANMQHSVIASTSKTTNETYESSMRKEEVPLIQQNSQKFMQNEDYYKDVVEFGRYPQPMPQFITTQSVNETTEIIEQTTGGSAGSLGTAYITGGGTAYNIGTAYNAGTVYNTGGLLSRSGHHASHRDLDLLFYSQNNGTDYELSNVTCFTMTPNGKYALIGQSVGTPQIWDTINGQLIRSMNGTCTNCSNLELTCNGSLLVGLASDNKLPNDGLSYDPHALSLQIWEVTSGKPIQMSHQIKCCVFAVSADSNSIFMAGNQRFGRGISVGILDLVTNELTKEIKSDPTISFGDNPESITITPDERYAIVGCRSHNGTNFVVFDITKSTEIAQTKSISLDAEPKCIQILNNLEVLTGTRGGHLIQWNLHSCKPSLSFIDPSDSQAHRGSINQISLSENKEFLVSASSDGSAKIWNTNTKNLVSSLIGHRGEVTCASISNNDLVVTGSTDQTVGLWRLYTGQQISSMPVGMNLIEANMAKHNKTIVAIGEKDGEQQLLMLRVINVQR